MNILIYYLIAYGFWARPFRFRHVTGRHDGVTQNVNKRTTHAAYNGRAEPSDGAGEATI